eukprot:scaffold50_cov420-Prasinococcus_capsulatus_cf.AAC.39
MLGKPSLAEAPLSDCTVCEESGEVTPGVDAAGSSTGNTIAGKANTPGPAPTAETGAPRRIRERNRLDAACKVAAGSEDFVQAALAELTQEQRTWDAQVLAVLLTWARAYAQRPGKAGLGLRELSACSCVSRAWRAMAVRELRRRFRERWNLKEVTGQPCCSSFWERCDQTHFRLVHWVMHEDSLVSIALKYNTTTGAIMQHSGKLKRALAFSAPCIHAVES